MLNAVDLIARYDVRAPGPRRRSPISPAATSKVLFGRELAIEPRLVVYNKPTYGLDVANIRSARQRIRDAADASVAAVPDRRARRAARAADRIGVMHGGRLVGIVEKIPNAEARVGQLMVAGTVHDRDCLEQAGQRARRAPAGGSGPSCR